jgi:predicted methyltransferase
VKLTHVGLYVLSISGLLSCATTPPPAQPPLTISSPAPQPVVPTTIAEAVANSERTPKNVARDRYRHPQQTLEFFGLKPNMTVVEIWPSSGWYSEILAPLLAKSGHYIAAIRTSTDPTAHDDHSFQDWLQAHPLLKDSVGTASFNPTERIDLGAPGSADMVLTFRNVHNWMKAGAVKEAFSAFYKVLKPGGVLGVVEHRGRKDRMQDRKAKNGYVREEYIIKLARDAGFKQIEKAEINANAADTKDYPDGVWTLPPTYTLGEKDHAKFEAIGESDRMTLKFTKKLK